MIHEEIINYINQGIEMAMWKPFIFIDMSNEGILISAIIPNEKGTYDSVFIELFDSMLSVENIIYKYFDITPSEERMFYNDTELEEITKDLLKSKVFPESSPGLSTVIMASGHEDFWNQLFFAGRATSINNKGTEDEFIGYNFSINELAIHTTLIGCIDHMYTFFGYD